MKEKDIDKLFRDAVQSEEATPSPQLWAKIAQQLDEEAEREEGIVPMIATTKKPVYAWVKLAAACALIGLGLFAYFAQQHEPVAPNTQIVQQKPATQKTNKPKTEGLEQAVESTVAHAQPVKNIFRQEKQLAYSPIPLQKAESMKTSPNIVPERKRIAPVRLPLEDQISVMADLEIPKLDQVQLAEVQTMTELPTRYVTDVEPIKPLIEPFEEEEEMMIAGTVRKATGSVISKIIHVVNDNTPTQVTKDIYVLKDDEGSFRLELGNIFAKNRTKKRK